MTIGIPKALLYYRYQYLWKTFFRALDCEVITSEDTSKEILSDGIRLSIDESCLPLKIFLGHVQSLIGRCDYVLLPRFESYDKDEELCVRLFGLYDIVRSIYGEEKLLNYNLKAGKYKSELYCFLHMGRVLGKSPIQSYRAYQSAKEEQELYDRKQCREQKKRLYQQNLKILMAAQSYILHDPYLGGPAIRLVKAQGGIPIYSDRCDRRICRKKSKEISTDLYWTMNKETIGAIAAYKDFVDGVIFLTAFPCGTDSLVNELTMRRVKDVPIIQIIVDEQQGDAGLQTRIESFMDILQQRKKEYGT